MSLPFDPLSESYRRDPYPHYARLRVMPGLPRFEAVGMVMATRFEDIRTITLHPACVRSLDGHITEAEARERQRAANWHDMPYHERVVQFSLLDSDGDTHRRLRKRVFGAFQNDAITALEPVVRAYVRRRLDALSGAQTFDFTRDFAEHIPGFLIGTLLGVPEEDQAQMKDWSHDVVAFFDLDRSAAKKHAAETATRDFYHYLRDLMDERLARPRDDLISRMLTDYRAGHFSDDEFISTCMLILMAGHGSSIDALGSALNTLMHHGDAWKTLRANPTLLPNALQEMFRYEPPLPFFHRHALEDIEVAGHVWPAGTTYGLLYGAANRDEAVFDAASTFDIHRHPNRHLAFGHGAHLCLGNHLARMNMGVIFTELFARYERFEPNGEPLWRRGLSVRGPESLPVRGVAV